MIGVLYHQTDTALGERVLAALWRSVTLSGAVCARPGELSQYSFLLAVNPDEFQGKELLNWLAPGGRKLILFGQLPTCLWQHFAMTPGALPASEGDWARSPAAHTGQYAESPASIHYLPAAAALGAKQWRRALERFDFSNEWNNLGYGAVRADGSAWSIAAALRAPVSAEIANIQLNGQVITSYCARFDERDSSVLWVNRAAGLIDSFEWRLIETFICHWRYEVLPCCPVVSEIPFGHDIAVTMRLDCDEDIASAEPLWQAYKTEGVPFSLALHSGHLPNEQHTAFLKRFVAEGGAILSHSATHTANWGGDYQAAYREGSESRTQIEQATGIRVAYAVSPFHQSPEYALAALSDMGYHGCIGGIIRNDPEFIIARGGVLAHLPPGFIGHSQQCMLHGDCLLMEGDPLAIYKQAFEQAQETRTLFGYLDHPFSVRYHYGWPDEQSRIAVHRHFIAWIRQRAARPLFLDERRALDFLRYRAAIRLYSEGETLVANLPAATDGFRFAVEFRGSLYEITDGARLV